MEQFTPPREFRNWLQRTSLSDRAIGDTVSRLRRLSRYVDISHMSSETQLKAALIQAPEFSQLGAAVRSQLKRAGNLYLTFQAARKDTPK